MERCIYTMDVVNSSLVFTSCLSIVSLAFKGVGLDGVATLCVK